MSGDWYDVVPAAYARNLGRMLNGQRVVCEPDGEGHLRGCDFTIDRVKDVFAGIDTNGLFVGVTVVDTDGSKWVLADDDAVEDSDGACVGKFKLGKVGRRALAASRAVSL